jgi:hypothetical protein
LRIADCGLRIADCGLRIADCGLRIALSIDANPNKSAIDNPNPQSPIANRQSSTE